MVAAMNLYTVRKDNTWLNEDGHYIEDQAQAKAMPYEVAESFVMRNWKGSEDKFWIELEGFKPRKTIRVKWIEFQIRFLESFREPNDTTNFPGWITKQINKRKEKLNQKRR